MLVLVRDVPAAAVSNFGMRSARLGSAQLSSALLPLLLLFLLSLPLLGVALLRDTTGSSQRLLKLPTHSGLPQRCTANYKGSFDTIIINNSYITQLPIVIAIPVLD